MMVQHESEVHAPSNSVQKPCYSVMNGRAMQIRFVFISQLKWIIINSPSLMDEDDTDEFQTNDNRPV